MAIEVAAIIGGQLDLLSVCELEIGDAFHPPLYVGVVGEADRQIIHRETLAELDLLPIEISAAIAEAKIRIHDGDWYRADHKAAKLRGRDVVIIDDGTSSPTHLRAAIEVAQLTPPRLTVLAVPMAPQEVLDTVEDMVDRLVALDVPQWLPWFLRYGHIYAEDPGAIQLRDAFFAREGLTERP